MTYAAPRLKGTTYDEISGHLVLRLEDNGFDEVDRSEEAVRCRTRNRSASRRQGCRADGRAGLMGGGRGSSQEPAAGERLEIRLASAWGAATLGVFAPDGSRPRCSRGRHHDLIVEKAVAGDYVIHVAGGAGTPSRTALNVLARGCRQPRRRPHPAADMGCRRCPDPGDKVVYLTFDDGPDCRYTPKILEALRKYDARATFFVIGTNLQSNRSIAEKIVAQGSTIANHTWNHESLKGVSREQFQSAVGRTQELMGSLGTKCLRPPYGATDENTWSYAQDIGLTVWNWSIDTVDYRKPSPDMITERAGAAGPGSVVLMHDGGG